MKRASAEERLKEIHAILERAPGSEWLFKEGWGWFQMEREDGRRIYLLSAPARKERKR